MPENLAASRIIQIMKIQEQNKSGDKCLGE
jgi:hypothetical protein